MSDLFDDLRNLERVWTSADHTRDCNARYGAGACTCGYDSQLDLAVVRVISHIEEHPALTKAEVDDLMVKISQAALPSVEKGNALLSRLSPPQGDHP